MSAGLTEQNDDKGRGRSHPEVKRIKNKRERRRAKKYPEVQPTYRKYHGWVL